MIGKHGQALISIKMCCKFFMVPDALQGWPVPSAKRLCLQALHWRWPLQIQAIGRYGACAQAFPCSLSLCNNMCFICSKQFILADAYNKAKQGTVTWNGPCELGNVDVGVEPITVLHEHIILGSSGLWALLSANDACLRSHFFVKVSKLYGSMADLPLPGVSLRW